MELDDLLQQTGEWLKGTGPNADIVMSSRIRLARNLAHHPFSPLAKAESQRAVFQQLEQALRGASHLELECFVALEGLGEVDKQFLVERRLMSREHAVGADQKAVAIGKHEVLSVMVNEEDHLRLQAMQSGFNLREAWRIIDALDDELSRRLDYAYSEDWGYLTACPTNTGTGLRGSVMVHLPALVLTKQINKVLQAIAKLSLTARGLYGEGTEAAGNFFQISNQVTLGHAEEELIDNIERIIRQVIEYEQNARELLLKQDRMRLEDRVGRAFGTLKSAHIISSAETVDLLSAIRLGVDLNFVSLDRRVVNELFLLTQPAHLQKLEGRVLSANERDARRAALIRQRLANGT